MAKVDMREIDGWRYRVTEDGEVQAGEIGKGWTTVIDSKSTSSICWPVWVIRTALELLDEWLAARAAERANEGPKTPPVFGRKWIRYGELPHEWAMVPISWEDGDGIPVLSMVPSPEHIGITESLCTAGRELLAWPAAEPNGAYAIRTGKCVMCDKPIGDSPSPVACRDCADYAFNAASVPRKEPAEKDAKRAAYVAATYHDDNCECGHRYGAHSIFDGETDCPDCSCDSFRPRIKCRCGHYWSRHLSSSKCGDCECTSYAPAQPSRQGLAKTIEHIKQCVPGCPACRCLQMNQQR